MTRDKARYSEARLLTRIRNNGNGLLLWRKRVRSAEGGLSINTVFNFKP